MADGDGSAASVHTTPRGAERIARDLRHLSMAMLYDYGRLTMRGLLWEAYYGRLTMGGSLWEAHYGRLTMGGLLWGAYYGRLTMGGLLWEAY